MTVTLAVPGTSPIKSAWHLLILTLVLNSPVYAAPITASAPLTNAVSNQIGIAAAVRGTVKISNQAQVGKIVSSGEAIFLGDEVTTDNEGNLQILLLDETTFTIGPNSAIIIDKFIYDPSTYDGEVKAKVVKGVFRFVTGKIGQKKPQQMEVELPSGTIGIRGTIVAGEVNGKKSTIMLFGPGERNNTGHRQGSFVLSNQSGGKISQETVNKTGFGSTIEGEGAAPTKPFQVPAEQMNKINNALGPVTNPTGQGNAQPGNDPKGPSDNRSATDQSGQGKFQGREFVRQSREMGKIFQKLESESNEAAQQIIQNAGTQVLNGPTTRNQLQAFAQSVGGGIHRFEKHNIPLTTAGGTADFFVDINFGSRQIGGGFSKVVGSLTGASDTFEFPITSTLPFGFGPDNATYQFQDILNTSVGSTCASTSCKKADIGLALDNVNGIVAGGAHVQIDIKNNSNVLQSSGQDGAVPRLQGQTI